MFSEAQLRQYTTNGYVVIDDFFTAKEIRHISEHADLDLQNDSPRRVLESSSGFVRAVHGSHLEVPFFRSLIRISRFVNLAQQILDDQVYIHQFKINAKKAYGGELWEWHQDSYFWKHEDGMPTDNSVNFVVHLDEANDANGPLMLIPGSHRNGLLSYHTDQVSDDPKDAWKSTVSVALKHHLDHEALAALAQNNGIQAVTGRPGSVLVFHPTLVHGSTGNMSPFDRRLLILSYNAVSNALGEVESPRPEFLAGRTFTPIRPDDAERALTDFQLSGV